MTWKNATKDGLPQNKQEVLITVDGVNYVAMYNALKNLFETTTGTKFKIPDENAIYWQEITKPQTD
jgi:hypothetical protein